MELAQALSQLWRRKTWLALGVVVAALAGLASVQLLKSSVYAAATTQMDVDSQRSVLGNINASLDPFTARAGVFAQLMTTPDALNAIGQVARIPSTQIAAQGPDGLAQAAQSAGPQQTSKAATRFKLQFNQNPALPIVDIYAQAPTTQQAISLANAAVTGFAAYLRSLEAQGTIPLAAQVKIRQLGTATGGVVNPGASKKIAGLIAVAVLLVWCAVMLLVARRGAAWDVQPASAKAVAGTPHNGDLIDPSSDRNPWYMDGTVSVDLRHERAVADTRSGGEADHISGPDRVAAPAARRRVRWPSARDEG